jgi:hypothetical protein
MPSIWYYLSRSYDRFLQFFYHSGAVSLFEPNTQNQVVHLKDPKGRHAAEKTTSFCRLRGASGEVGNGHSEIQTVDPDNVLLSELPVAQNCSHCSHYSHCSHCVRANNLKPQLLYGSARLCDLSFRTLQFRLGSACLHLAGASAAVLVHYSAEDFSRLNLDI